MAECNSNNNTTNNNTVNNDPTNSGSNTVSGGANFVGVTFGNDANLIFNSTLADQALQPWTVPCNDPDRQLDVFHLHPLVHKYVRARLSGESSRRGLLHAATLLAVAVGGDVHTEGDVSILHQQIDDFMSHNLRPLYEKTPSENIAPVAQKLIVFRFAQHKPLTGQQHEHFEKTLELQAGALQRCIDSEIGRRSSTTFRLKLWIIGQFNWHRKRSDFDSLESFKEMMLIVRMIRSTLKQDEEALRDVLRERLALCAAIYGKRDMSYIQALGTLGMSLQVCENEEEAVAKLSEAITLMTDLAIEDTTILKYQFSLGKAYFNLRQWSDAAQVLEKIIEDVRARNFPEHRNLRKVKLYLGATYHAMGRSKDVIATLESVLVDVDLSQLEFGIWTGLLIALPPILTSAYCEEKRFEDVVKLIGPSGPADASGPIPETVSPWQRERALRRLAFSYSKVGEWEEATRILQVLKEDHGQRYGVDSEEQQRIATALGHLERRRAEQSANETSEQASHEASDNESVSETASTTSIAS